MYEEYWKLAEKPFENTPDPRFFYRSTQHDEGLMRLLYAIRERKGAAMLTGVFGCGKTLLAQVLFEELGKAKYKLCLVSNPQLNYVQLLREIVYGLGVKEKLPREKTDLLHLVREILSDNLKDGKETVVVIDEAHVIEDDKVFEELRMLLNLQLKDRFLLTLVLSGQPELREKVQRLKQFSQRIAIKCHLEQLSGGETVDYVVHRLKVAGREDTIFSPGALRSIHEYSGGIPRRINHLCDLGLLVGFGKKSKEVDEQIVQEVAKDLEE